MAKNLNIREILHRVHFEEEWRQQTKKELYEKVPKQCKEVIAQAESELNTYINQKIVEELENIQTIYGGRFVAQTYIHDEPITLEERIKELETVRVGKL